MEHRPAHAARSRRRLWLRLLRWMPGALFVVWVAMLAWDGSRAMAQADAIAVAVEDAENALEARDPEALSAAVDELSTAATAFASHTSGVHWWLAARLPWVGDQVEPLQAAGEAMQVLADDALEPLAALPNLDVLTAPPIVNGRIDPLVLEPYRPAVAAADVALESQVQVLAEVNVEHTIAAVGEPFEELRRELDRFSGVVSDAHDVARLLPTMLGAEGTREYMVLVQNNSEPRATGGIPGAVLSVTVNDGRIVVGDYYSANELNVAEQEVADLTSDEIEIFTRRMALYLQDVTFTPEFPRTGELAAAFWERGTGRKPDGVVSIDPVALGYLMAHVPARDVAGIVVSGQNLADVMLHDVYAHFEEPARQDAFFALAVSELFPELLTGGTATMAGLERAVDEGRFMVWSADPAEQEILGATDVGGDFLRNDSSLGVFLNDGSGSKIGYYVEMSVTGHGTRCGTDAPGRVASGSVEATISHTADLASGDLPPSISGAGTYVPEGEFHANVLVYPPRGMAVTNLTSDGAPGAMRPVNHAGRPAAIVRVELLPGQTVRLAWDLKPFEPNVIWETIDVTPGPKSTSTTYSVEIDGRSC